MKPPLPMGTGMHHSAPQMTYPVAEAELALESPIANTLSRVASMIFVFSIPISPVVVFAGSAIYEKGNLRCDLPGNYLAARSTSQGRSSGGPQLLRMRPVKGARSGAYARA